MGDTFENFDVSLGTITSCNTLLKSQRLAQFLFHLMWSRWRFNFLVNDLSVVKNFTFQLLVQCSICPLYRKKVVIKKVIKKIPPSYPNFIEELTPNTQVRAHTHTHIHPYKYIYICVCNIYIYIYIIYILYIYIIYIYIYTYI